MPAAKATNIDEILRQIEQIESGGDPNAKNPRSSASGLYQFTDATWLDTVKRYEPGLMEGRTKQEVLDLRFSEAISRRMGRAFTEDNIRQLESAGIEPTPSHIYLAHFLGPTGAQKALSADENASVADVLGEKVTKANPFLEGKAISDLADWASDKMGQDSPLIKNPAPAVEAVPGEEAAPTLGLGIGAEAGVPGEELPPATTVEPSPTLTPPQVAGTVSQVAGTAQTPPPAVELPSGLNVTPDQMTGAVAPGLHYEAPTEEAGVGLGEQLAGAFNRQGVSFSVVRDMTADRYDAEVDFDPLAEGHISEEEINSGRARRYVRAQSSAELADMRRRDQAEEDWVRAIDRGPLNPFVAEALGAILDPINLLPFVGASQAMARTGMSTASRFALGAGAETAGSEAILQSTQNQRSAQESVAAIVMGLGFGGVLGAVSGRLGPTARAEDGTVRAAVKDQATLMNTQGGESIGAARAPTPAEPPLTETDTQIAKAFGLEKMTAKLANWSLASAAFKMASSPIQATREMVHKLTDVGAVTEGNLRGLAMAPDGSAEVRMRGRDVDLAQTNAEFEGGYLAHKREQKANGGQPMSKEEFDMAVGHALDKGDVHRDAAVQQQAKYLRGVINRVTDEAIEVGVMTKEDLDLKGTQQSYFPRSYKMSAMLEKGSVFREKIARFLERKGVPDDDETAEGLAQGIYNQITGMPSGRTVLVRLPESAKRGSVQERTLTIPNSEISEFIDFSSQRAMGKWLRTMSAEIELHRVFGDTPDKGVEDIVQRIQSDGREMVKEGADPAKMERQIQEDITDTTALVRRIRGTDRAPDDARMAGLRNTGIFMRNTVVATRMGGVLLSNIPDAAKIAMKHGLANTMKFVAADAGQGFKDLKLSKKMTQKFGGALETSLHQRSQATLEFHDQTLEGGGKTMMETAARGSSKVAGAVMKFTGLNHMVEIQKSVASMLTSTGILDAGKKLTEGKTLTARETRMMAQSNLTQPMLKRIGEQGVKHGQDAAGGNRHANLDAWTDRGASHAMERAVLREIDDTVVTPFRGDRPNWAGTEWGQVLGQFKSFMFSSTIRNFLQAAQQLKAGEYRTATGLMSMMALGGMVVAMKDGLRDGEIEDRSPQQWAIEAIDRSGLMAWFFEGNSLIQPALSQTGLSQQLAGQLGLSEPGRFQGKDFLTRALGPSADQVGDIVGAIPNLTEGKPTTGDIRQGVNLIPGNNLFYIQWINKLLQEVIANQFDLPERRQ